MGEIVSMRRYKRARLGGTDGAAYRSPRPRTSHPDGDRGGFVHIGDVSFELLRKLME